MDAKQKARHLVMKYHYLITTFHDHDYQMHVCRKAALIAVEEIIEYEKRANSYYLVTPNIGAKHFWEEVKTELTNLT